MAQDKYLASLNNYRRIIDIKSIKLKSFTGTVKKIVEYCLSQDIEVFQVFENQIIFILKKDTGIVWIHKSLSSISNPIGINIARNKYLMKCLLEKFNIPTIPGILIENEEDLMMASQQLGYPLVIKPTGAAEGKGITININNQSLLIDSFRNAKLFGKDVLIEKHIAGDYFRITYIADGTFAVTKNLPAYIEGDGLKTALEIILSENKCNKERRTNGRLNKLKISDKTERMLKSSGYRLDSVIKKGDRVPICFSGFDGGEYVDATEEVHKSYIAISKKICSLLGLPIIGLDILSTNINEHIDKSGGVVIEVNGTFPDIQIHNKTTIGARRDLTPNFVNFLFKQSLLSKQTEL